MHYPQLFCLGLLGAFLLNGCTALPLSPPLPPPLRLSAPIPLAPDSPVAWSPDGAWLAYVADGLCLRTASDGVTRRIAAIEAAQQIVFSPDGRELAVALVVGEGTLLRRYHLADGQFLGERQISGRCSGLLWPRAAELLAVQTETKSFSFGGNHVVSLIFWDGDSGVREVPLADTTLTLTTLRNWGGILAEVGRPTLSPWQDELLLSVLRDPPAFAPYLELLVVPLTAGAPHSVARMQLPGGNGVYVGPGDELLVSGVDSHLTRFDPWRGTQQSLQLAGQGTLSLSPGGRYLLVNGALYGDERLVTRFPPAVRGNFGGDGRLALAHGAHLYVLEGLNDRPSFVPPADEQLRQRLLLLRQWRNSGLISHADYLSQKELP